VDTVQKGGSQFSFDFWQIEAGFSDSGYRTALSWRTSPNISDVK
jgi:hypothetical protein